MEWFIDKNTNPNNEIKKAFKYNESFEYLKNNNIIEPEIHHILGVQGHNELYNTICEQMKKSMDSKTT